MAEEEARGGHPTYWGRWVGFDGNNSPWSLPASLAGARQKAIASTEASTNATDEGDDD